MIDWCDNNWNNNGDEIDSTPSLTAGTTYYLMIDEWDMVAGSYNLIVTYP